MPPAAFTCRAAFAAHPVSTLRAGWATAAVSGRSACGSRPWRAASSFAALRCMARGNAAFATRSRPRVPPAGLHGPGFSQRRGYQDDPRIRNARPLLTTQQLGRMARSPNTHIVLLVGFLGAVAFYFSHLETVSVSGRTRFNCFSEGQVEKVSSMQYERVIYEVEHSGGRFLPDWDPRTQLARRVMKRLIPVSGLADQDWQVNVIDDPQTANAFVLPGGKVFVFTGILPLVRSESGLAAVLGHEIAHNVAEHVAERLSQSIGENILFGSILLLSAAIPGALLAVQFFGGRLLDFFFSRPMSRLQESEADFIGLLMMAEACYDPREAVDFWRRMDKAQELQPPEWMSTHPSHRSRIEKIQEWLPQAMDKRMQSDCRGTSAFADMFRTALKRGSITVDA